MNVSLPHIRFEKIADLVDGRLAGDELERVRAHLDRCGACARERSKLENALMTMRDDRSEDAPRPAIAGALAAFQPRIRESSVVRRLVAALTFDSLEAAPAQGMRSGSAEDRQMVFSAADNEVHLQQVAATGGWVLKGQVLGDCEGGTVELSTAVAAVKVALSPMCEFELPALEEGVYRLVLRLEDVEIEVPDLNLGA